MHQSNSSNSSSQGHKWPVELTLSQGDISEILTRMQRKFLVKFQNDQVRPDWPGIGDFPVDLISRRKF